MLPYYSLAPRYNGTNSRNGKSEHVGLRGHSQSITQRGGSTQLMDHTGGAER